MMLRGAGERDGRQFILDLDSLGVERHEAVSNAHATYSGATVAENLPAALAIYADLLRRPHLPDEQLESCRQVVLQDLRAVEDEPAEKVMIELRRSHYPHPWGRPAQGEQAALEAASLDDIRALLPAPLPAQRHDPGRGGPRRLGAAGGPGRPIAGRLAAAAGRRPSSRSPPARNTATSPTTRSRRRSASPTAASPTGTPTISRPGGRWACSAAA